MDFSQRQQCQAGRRVATACATWARRRDQGARRGEQPQKAQCRRKQPPEGGCLFDGPQKPLRSSCYAGGEDRNRTDLDGFAGRCITSLLPRQRTYFNSTKKGSQASLLIFWSGRRVSNSRPQPWQGCALPTELLPHWSLLLQYGAGEESRTLDLNLGKVALYQLSYSRILRNDDYNMLDIWSGRRVSNSRPQPWQGCALPTELLPLRHNRQAL